MQHEDPRADVAVWAHVIWLLGFEPWAALVEDLGTAAPSLSMKGLWSGYQTLGLQVGKQPRVGPGVQVLLAIWTPRVCKVLAFALKGPGPSYIPLWSRYGPCTNLRSSQAVVVDGPCFNTSYPYMKTLM